ncbi:hypothetical protein EMIHUDRAFT_441693 [Emiliania huxleyi CCMP1516]|uniref:Uncharacterized protein n=2 Tax=Emiliania huxleyi TaxID=2903 RepID=A0A0D3KB36_EMIH1|nr:hypothetical protein EMIHUDRAFT_441693 [Emiliania huxleyi CCMP1516]EOD32971.1 hypothetical protein EMIHUDRAFT_441693 [Emiliania huxleyi CCMP1516]|eukprot:XP_005785400.1 hypothetical protein EMIHUDRAFT_441693 [Emiliania huxleyi CCMP1516]
MERTIAIPQGWGKSTARREEWSKCVARYAALCSKPVCVGDGDEDLPGKSTPTSSGALDHLASIATEELLRRRSKRKRSIIDRPLGEAPVPVVKRVLNHWLTGHPVPDRERRDDGGVHVLARRLRLHRALHRGGGHAGLLAEVPNPEHQVLSHVGPRHLLQVQHERVPHRLRAREPRRLGRGPDPPHSDPAQRRAAHGRPGGDHAPALGGHRRRPRPLLPALLCGLADASSCAWVSPLSRRALERVRGSFGEDAPLARASWSAEEGDGGAGGGGVGGGSGGGSGGDP